MRDRRFTTPLPVDLRLSLGPLWSGRPDPVMRLSKGRTQMAWRTPQGDASIDVRVLGGGREVECRAWGAGADWAVDRIPALVGAHDHLVGFEPAHPLLERAHRRLPGLRFGATGQIFDALPRTILAQKVTGLEANRAWLAMCRAWGEPAPGPLGLRLPPSREVLGSRPYWALHRMGVERKRATTLIEACRRLDRLEEAVGMPGDEALRRLTALPGIGPWTAAIVLRAATGDPDTVEVGDYHISDHVAWVLAGEPRGDDRRMLELLEPYAGHRGRVIRLIGAGCDRPPTFGPRTRIRDVSRL